MGEEDGIKPGSGDGMEMHQSHDERLGLGDVRLGEITHADAGTGDSQDEPQREVILEERDVADTGIAHAAEQEEADGEEEKSAGPEEPRGANLHDAVDGFDKAHTAGNRIHEEAEVAEEDDEEAVMEKETENPEPLGGIVNQAGALVDGIIGFDFRVDVAEKRTEQEHFKDHALDNTPGGVRAVPFGLFNEIKRFFLTAGGRDGERNWRFGPPDHAPNNADEKDRYRHVRQDREPSPACDPNQAMIATSATTSKDLNIPYLSIR